MSQSEEEISKEDLIDDNSELEKNSGTDTDEAEHDSENEKDEVESSARLINQEAGGDSKSNTLNKKSPNTSQNNSPAHSPQARKRKPRKD